MMPVGMALLMLVGVTPTWEPGSWRKGVGVTKVTKQAKETGRGQRPRDARLKRGVSQAAMAHLDDQRPQVRERGAGERTRDCTGNREGGERNKEGGGERERERDYCLLERRVLQGFLYILHKSEILGV